MVNRGLPEKMEATSLWNSDKFRNAVATLKSDLENKVDFLPFLALSFPILLLSICSYTKPFGNASQSVKSAELF